jgi:hypothetical protein
MTFEFVKTHTFTPEDLEVVLGTFSMEPEDDCIWFRITQDNPDPWPWSYGIIGWRTSFGYELGSTKCYSNIYGEVTKLSSGLQPLERTGVLTFEPRSFNLSWVKKGTPWTLTFEAQSGSLVSGPPALGVRATLGVFDDLADSRVTYAITDGFASIKLLKN